MSSLRLLKECEERRNPPVMRLITTEMIRAGNKGEDERDVDVWIDPVLSDIGVAGLDMLDLMELSNKFKL